MYETKLQIQKAIVSSGPIENGLILFNISMHLQGKWGLILQREILKWIPNLSYVHGNVSDKYAYLEGAKTFMQKLLSP